MTDFASTFLAEQEDAWDYWDVPVEEIPEWEGHVAREIPASGDALSRVRAAVGEGSR